MMARFCGRIMVAGYIYTVAGTGLIGFSGDGGPALSAMLDQPGGVTVDAVGNLLVSDTANNRIRVVAERGGARSTAKTMTTGDIYTIAGGPGFGCAGDGGLAGCSELAEPGGLALDHADNLLIADQGNNRVRVVAARTGRFYDRPMRSGFIYSIAGGDGAGNGGPATRAGLSVPGEVTVDGAGNVVIADTGNFLVRVIATQAGHFYGRTMTAGHIYIVAGNGLVYYSGDGGQRARSNWERR